MTAPPPPVAFVEVGKVHPDLSNRPRRSGDQDLQGLADTIRVFGILVPIWVAPHPQRTGHFIIKAGHRRYLAAQMAGLGEVPCTLRRPRPIPRLDADAAAALAQIVEQVHRVPWTPVEFALKLGSLAERGMSQADIARYLGLAESTVSYHMELLDADQGTLDRVERGELTAGSVHDAVRLVRQAQPEAPGPVTPHKQYQPRYHKPAQPARKPPPHFIATHRLAADARARCQDAGHEAWTRLGGVACGQCWEDTIAGDAASRVVPYRRGAA